MKTGVLGSASSFWYCIVGQAPDSLEGWVSGVPVGRQVAAGGEVVRGSHRSFRGMVTLHPSVEIRLSHTDREELGADRGTGKKCNW